MLNLRWAIRMLLKNPGSTAVAVLTLVICVGATVAIFGVIESVVRRHLPFPTPDQLMTLFNARADATVERGSFANSHQHPTNPRAPANLGVTCCGAAILGQPGGRFSSK